MKFALFENVPRKKLVFAAFCFVFTFSLLADDPFTGDIDGTDGWNGANVNNFIDVTSPITGVVTDGILLTVDATTGTPNGTVSYDGSNSNLDEEVNVNIAGSIDQATTITYDVQTAQFPVGLTEPYLIFRDIDDNSDGSVATGTNEFCDRLDITAFDTSGNPISPTDMTLTQETAPVTAARLADVGNTMVIEAITAANDGPGTTEIRVSFDTSNVQQIVVVYSACDKPDVDRPGAMGIVGGINGSVPTADLIIRKQWIDANIGDSTVVNTTTTTTSTVPSLNSTAGSANEIDAAGAVEIRSGFDYTIAEVLDAGNTGFYDQSTVCTGTGDADVSDGVLTPAGPDSNITCTVINDGRLADLVVSKSDGLTEYTPGAAFSYDIIVTNNGPDGVANAVLTDTIPGWAISPVWTCSSTGGAICSAINGSGNLNEVIPSLPLGGTVTYTVTGTYSNDMSDY